MKKLGLFILSLFVLFFIGNISQAKDYEYINLDITANILNDGTINVKENFTAKFFVSKHGIIRDIPLNYSVGGKNFHIEISNINVQGKNFITNKNNGNIEIKIGDANKTIIGEQNYPISYSTYGLIRNFSGMGYAELYWNLVGYDFDTNINKVRAEIILPKAYTGFTSEDFLITTDGKSKTIDGFDGIVDWSKGDRIIITYNKQLPAYQGITLAIKFPNNYFDFDHDRQAGLIELYKNSLTATEIIFSIMLGLMEIIFFIAPYLIAFIPFICTIAVIIKFVPIFIKKIRFIRDKNKIEKVLQKKYPIITQYDPPKGLNSAEVGLLLSKGATRKALSTLIYKWAYEGYLQIKQTASGYLLERLKTLPGDYPKYERVLFETLLELDEKEIGGNGDSLYYNFDSSLGLLDEYGIEKGRFTENVEEYNSQTLGCDYYLGIFVSILFIPFIPPFGIILLVFLIIVGMGEKGKLKKTEEGAKLISHILGYKDFIKTCDEDKLRLFLQQDPLYFDKILPYAVVFGLETEFIKKIQPIMQEMNISPIRYKGDFKEMSDTISTISTVSSYSSSSSSYSSDSGWDSGSSFDSGGSSFDSGGGGGGGGGSSW